ncbi:MAG: hypothetical protein ACTSX8_03255 [Alphaproteobacteria bacterium]
MSSVSYEYVDLSLSWEIWESGRQAGFFDGNNEDVRKKMIELGMQCVRTFHAADVNEARDVFAQWAKQQHPPVGSIDRARLFAVDMGARAIH